MGSMDMIVYHPEMDMIGEIIVYHDITGLVIETRDTYIFTPIEGWIVLGRI
jgi:hypothetical protein